MAYPGNGTAPDGWTLCDGSAINRATYSALFTVIGTTYGTGDGSSTFNLPDLSNKFIQGDATAGTVKAAGLPNITGAFKIRGWVTTGGTQGSPVNNFAGALQQGSDGSSSGSIGAGSNQHVYKTVTLDASLSSSVYGASTTVQPPAVTMRYLIYTGVTNKRKWLRTA